VAAAGAAVTDWRRTAPAGAETCSAAAMSPPAPENGSHTTIPALRDQSRRHLATLVPGLGVPSVIPVRQLLAQPQTATLQRRAGAIIAPASAPYAIRMERCTPSDTPECILHRGQRRKGRSVTRPDHFREAERLMALGRDSRRGIPVPSSASWVSVDCLSWYNVARIIGPDTCQSCI
jgi:hypothetical protein